MRNPLKVTPYDFQVKGIDFLIDHHYCILGDEMGLGKTLQAIALADILELKVLVVCPAFLKQNWVREWGKLSKFERVFEIVHHKKMIADIKLDSVNAVIISYGMLKEATDLFKWADVVICDEIHYGKNIKADRTKILHDLLMFNPPSRFIGISGTPVTNRVPEWYSLIGMCSYSPVKTNGLKLTLNYWEFCHKYTHVKKFQIPLPTKSGETKYRNIIKYTGVRNIEGLKHLLKNKYIRRLAKNQLDLPEIIVKDVVVNHTREGDLELWEEFNDGKTSATSENKAKSAVLKAYFTKDYVNNLIEEGQGPILVYSDHLAPVSIIVDGIKGKAKFIDGSVVGDERDKIVEEFQAGKLDALVSTIGAGSVGYTMTVANNVVFNDLSWVPADNKQAIKRIHRIGQTKKCIVHRVIGSKVDTKIYDALEEKEIVLGKVL